MSIKPALLLNNALQSNNCPNLILYGDKCVGKNYELMRILNKFISEENNKIIIEKDIIKITNPLYSIFDLKPIGNKNIHKFFNILIELFIHFRWEHLVYQFAGYDHVIEAVIKRGKVVYEKEKTILCGASRANQMRFHLGYHYPRSLKTLREVNELKDEFTAFAGE